MFIEIMKELFPANSVDPNFFNIITKKPWKDPVPAVVLIWAPLAFLVSVGISKVCSKVREG